MNYQHHPQHTVNFQPPQQLQPPPVHQPPMMMPAQGVSITAQCIPFMGPNLNSMNENIANKIKLLDSTELDAYKKKKEFDLELYKKQLEIEYSHQEKMRKLDINHMEAIRDKELNHLKQLHSISEGHSRAYAEKLGHIS